MSAETAPVPSPSYYADFVTCARLLSAGLRRAWWVSAGLAVAAAALEACVAVAVWQLLTGLGGASTGIFPALSSTALGWLALGLVLLKNAVRLVELVVRERAVERTAATLSARIFQAWLRAPWREHLLAAPGRPAFESGELAAVAVREVFFSVATVAAESLVFIGLVVVLMIVAPAKLTLLIAGGAVLTGAALAFTHRWQSRWGRQLHETSEEHAGFLTQSFAGTKELKSFGRMAAWEEAQQTRRDALARVTAQRVIFDQWPPVLVDTVFVGGVIAAALVVGRSEAGVGGGLSLVAFIAYAGFRLLPTLNRLIVRSQCLRSSRTSFALVAGRLRTGVETGAVLTERPGAGAKRGSGPVLAFEDAGFTYPGADTACLRGISLRLRAGESVAIMGPSGGGKTTLLHLALGLLAPTSGVLRSGAGAEGPVSWAGRAGYVGQDGWVCDHTLAGNIALTWNLAEIDGLRLSAALRVAQLSDWVATLPERELTMAGPGGSRLSGGQRQRLCLARALYAQPEILFLDEATAALDPQTEAGLLTAMREGLPGTTQLWVTHRESVARACDRVWFIVEGRLAAEGRYEDLLAGDAGFRSFVTATAE